MPKGQKQLKQKPPKTIAGTRSLSSFVKSICDIMRRSNCASALQYVPELTWILFLRILDAQEKRDREAAEAVGKSFSAALSSPFRWQDWAAPFKDEAAPTADRRGQALRLESAGIVFQRRREALRVHQHRAAAPLALAGY
jgi:type I restriction-modification system DNA methylase subunit